MVARLISQRDNRAKRQYRIIENFLNIANIARDTRFAILYFIDIYIYTHILLLLLLLFIVIINAINRINQSREINRQPSRRKTIDKLTRDGYRLKMQSLSLSLSLSFSVPKQKDKTIA